MSRLNELRGIIESSILLSWWTELGVGINKIGDEAVGCLIPLSEADEKRHPHTLFPELKTVLPEKPPFGIEYFWTIAEKTIDNRWQIADKRFNDYPMPPSELLEHLGIELKKTADTIPVLVIICKFTSIKSSVKRSGEYARNVGMNPSFPSRRARSPYLGKNLYEDPQSYRRSKPWDTRKTWLCKAPYYRALFLFLKFLKN